MKSKFLTLLIALFVGIAFIPAVYAVSTNSWNTGNGKWEIGANWSLGVPSEANVTFIGNNSVMAPGVVTIDPDTVASDGFNNCLTIADLTIKGAIGRARQLLIFNNGFSTPLTITNSLAVQFPGSIVISNGALVVTGFGFTDDSVVTINNGGRMNTDNSVIGSTGSGSLNISNGTWMASGVVSVGQNSGSQGTVTLSGDSFSTISTTHSFDIGGGPNSSGAVWINGGQFINTGVSTTVGLSGTGQMTISNGTAQIADLEVPFGGVGTLTVANGTLTAGSLSLCRAGGTGTVWVTGGQLAVTNTLIAGEMTVSNGTWQAGSVALDRLGDTPGTLNLVGGTITIAALQVARGGGGPTCTVTLAGAQLTTINTPTVVPGGGDAFGRVNMSAGKWFAGEVDLGGAEFSQGTLTMLGGQLVATNDPGEILVGGDGVGHMGVSGGSVITRSLLVGVTNSPLGELIMSAGSVTVLSNLTIGDCASNGFGLVEMTGGTLYVTNAAHNAVLEVHNGLFLFDGGVLVVDKLVSTNGCDGGFDHVGGTLSVGTILLDPDGDTDGDGLPNGWEQGHGLDPLSSTGNNGPDGDPDGDGYSNLQEYLAGSDPQNPLSTPAQLTPLPFQITSIARQGNNVVLTWTTAGGTTNQVQFISGTVNGSYATNGFINLGAQMLISGSGAVTTNFTDVGGATNKPARYYRVRQVQ